MLLLMEERLNPEAISERLKASDVLREKLCELPDKESLFLLYRYKHSDYIMGINFKAKGAKRHKMEADFGI